MQTAGLFTAQQYVGIIEERAIVYCNDSFRIEAASSFLSVNQGVVELRVVNDNLIFQRVDIDGSQLRISPEEPAIFDFGVDIDSVNERTGGIRVITQIVYKRYIVDVEVLLDVLAVNVLCPQLSFVSRKHTVFCVEIS